MPESIQLTKEDVSNSELFEYMESQIPYIQMQSLRDEHTELGGLNNWISSEGRNRAIDYCTDVFKYKFGLDMTPIHIDKTKYEEDQTRLYQREIKARRYYESQNCKPSYELKKISAIEISIKSIPMAIEDKLTWEQVVDFREDTVEIAKLHRFRRWADNCFEGKSPAQIEEEILHNLEDYEYALKKHGVITTLSGITTVVSSGLLSWQALQEKIPLVGIISCCTIALSTIQQMANMFIRYRDIERLPVAYIYDVINEPERWWGKKI